MDTRAASCCAQPVSTSAGRPVGGWRRRTGRRGARWVRREDRRRRERGVAGQGRWRGGRHAAGEGRVRTWPPGVRRPARGRGRVAGSTSAPAAAVDADQREQDGRRAGPGGRWGRATTPTATARTGRARHGPDSRRARAGRAAGPPAPGRVDSVPARSGRPTAAERRGSGSDGARAGGRPAGGSGTAAAHSGRAVGVSSRSPTRPTAGTEPPRRPYPVTMPRYEFRCRACGSTFEVNRPMAEASAPAQLPGRPRRHRQAALDGRAGRQRRRRGGGGGSGRDRRQRRRRRLLRRRLRLLTSVDPARRFEDQPERLGTVVSRSCHTLRYRCGLVSPASPLVIDLGAGRVGRFYDAPASRSAAA